MRKLIFILAIVVVFVVVICIYDYSYLPVSILNVSLFSFLFSSRVINEYSISWSDYHVEYLVDLRPAYFEEIVKARNYLPASCASMPEMTFTKEKVFSPAYCYSHLENGKNMRAIRIYADYEKSRAVITCDGD